MADDDILISKHGKHALRNYKYNAEDRSFLYKYFLSGLA